MHRTAAALLVALLVACGSDDGGTAADTTVTTEPTATTDAGVTSTTQPPTTTTEAGRVIEVEVQGGRPVGGPRTETVAVGERVTLRFVADAADEVHVHTYDHELELEPGVPAEVSFVADIPGRHEVELHDAGRLLFTLEVR